MSQEKAKNLYRQQALKKLTSPERLNQMIFLTSPKSWMAVLAVIIIFAVALFWGVFGELPRNVKGKGILIQSGGVAEIASLSGGKIEQLLYSEGDRVEDGAIIAIISQPQLELRRQNAAKKLEELYAKYELLANYDEKDFKMRKELLSKKQDIQQSIIDSNLERIKFIQQRIQAQEQLLREGLITEFTLSNTKQLYFEIQQEIEIKRNELKGINLELFEISKNNELSLSTLQERILDLEREIQEMLSEFSLNSSVKSPYEGRVVEVLVNPGRVIGVGEIVLTLELTNKQKELEAVIYMPPSEGKKVEKGMDVKLSPSTVEVEVYGYILGKVKHVSEYPASQAGMERVLGNSQLAQTFAGTEPPIAVIVTLQADTAALSGYRWTSVGPDVEIKSGTLCNAFITIERQVPITLLFPSLQTTLKRD